MCLFHRDDGHLWKVIFEVLANFFDIFGNTLWSFLWRVYSVVFTTLGADTEGKCRTAEKTTPYYAQTKRPKGRRKSENP